MSYEDAIKKSDRAYNAIMWHLYTHGGSAPLKDIMSLEGFETPYLSKAANLLLLSHRIEFGVDKTVTMVKDGK